MIQDETNALPNSSIECSLEKFKLGIDNIIYQIQISKDGNAWCALLGRDLQNGISGFGQSVKAALQDLVHKM